MLLALVSELSYSSIAIQNGEMAATAWLAMREMEAFEGRNTIVRNLLEYCRLDTLAMVLILKKMQEMLADGR